MLFIHQLQRRQRYHWKLKMMDWSQLRTLNNGFPNATLGLGINPKHPHVFTSVFGQTPFNGGNYLPFTSGGCR
jgi:hypothetical protein